MNFLKIEETYWTYIICIFDLIVIIQFGNLM